MPRGADYDDKVPHSDNAVEAAKDLTHGANANVSDTLIPQILPESSKDFARIFTTFPPLMMSLLTTTHV